MFILVNICLSGVIHIFKILVLKLFSCSVKNSRLVSHKDYGGGKERQNRKLEKLVATGPEGITIITIILVGRA